MKIPLLPIIGVILAGVVVIVIESAYVVRVDQQVLRLELGAVRGVVNAHIKREVNGEVVFIPRGLGSDSEAGLHFKLPLIQRLVYFDKKNLGFDLPPQEITAADQERLIVDAFVRWQIVDPLQFYRSANNEEGGRAQLRGIMGAALREVLGDAGTTEIISGQRAELMEEIRVTLNRGAQQYGIEIVDVRIKRADLPMTNSEQVFERMKSQRRQEAAQIRAEGDEESLRIRATADRTATVTRADARRQSDILRGEGDSQRNAIYADAYGRDQEFFSFFRSMQAYEKAIAPGTSIVMSPDSSFFRYFGDRDGSPDKRQKRR